MGMRNPAVPFLIPREAAWVQWGPLQEACQLKDKFKSCSPGIEPVCISVLNNVECVFSSKGWRERPVLQGVEMLQGSAIEVSWDMRVQIQALQAGKKKVQQFMVLKSTFCSCRRLQFSSLYPCKVTHNHL